MHNPMANHLPAVRLRITSPDGEELYNAVMDALDAVRHLDEGLDVWEKMLESSRTREIERKREIAPEYVLTFLYNYV